MTKEFLQELGIENKFITMPSFGESTGKAIMLGDLLETYKKQLIIQLVSQCLPSDEKMHDDLLDIIDKNLSCGTGQEAGILCNRFATTSFIRDYIKKLLANCG